MVALRPRGHMNCSHLEESVTSFVSGLDRHNLSNNKKFSSLFDDGMLVSINETHFQGLGWC